MESLKELRKARVGSQDKLARLSGITANTIARIERGEQSPSLATAKALADALGVPVDALLNGAAA